MAKKSTSVNSDSATISFDCPAELKNALENLAASRKKDVAAILVKLVEKGTKANIPQITFRCTSEQKESLEILAAASLSDVTTILLRLVDEFIKANAERISTFKAQAATPLIMSNFKPTPSKPAKTPKKKKPAQVVDKSIVITKADYNTILLHVEKINGGQRDFIPVLKDELAKLSCGDSDELIKKIVSGTSNDAINQTRLFLSNAPLIVEGEGVKYRLVKLNENYCELDIVGEPLRTGNGGDLKEGDGNENP